MFWIASCGLEMGDDGVYDEAVVVARVERLSFPSCLIF
jgi:hypothetical protein